MKILIIAGRVGKTAPGIVFERLIKGLAEYHQIDILTSNFSPSIDLGSIGEIAIIPLIFTHPRLEETSISFFHKNIIDIIWANKARKIIHKNYDLIFSFVSSNNVYSLAAGVKLSSYLKTKHYTYFVDAIPAPNGWIKNDRYFNGLKKIVNSYLYSVDGYFAANEKMLQYQLTTFKQKVNLKSGVIYNPSRVDSLQSYSTKKIKSNMFLYTGGIYGLRTPKYVLVAFKNILKKYPDSTLEFVGTFFPEHYLNNFTLEEKEKVFFHPYTTDLTEHYQRSIALIDIDANTANDVFLSSKIANYLFINRLIISITGENSPARNLFSNIPSILICNHEVLEIERAMEKAILEHDNIYFTDRVEVQNLFTIKNTISTINDYISALDYI